MKPRQPLNFNGLRVLAIFLVWRGNVRTLGITSIRRAPSHNTPEQSKIPRKEKINL
nr:MAG TPA: hypothetical protein [Caudoviricetes sp.]